MRAYLRTIWESVSTLVTGMTITWRHMVNIRKGNVTLQYPEERWPRPERDIGFDQDDYNVIRSRLHVDMDDCIGCLKCERVCPVDCIKIETEKVDKGEDIPDVGHTGITSNGTKKALLLTRFDIDMTECCYCNLCTYPCPEECIYMTGGPNSEKHPIDYEFSQFDRNDMVYRFAKEASEEQVEKATCVKNGEKKNG
ncbi:MAG: 4Fe-4S dicluster domain-containing protein [Candidatus Marinimicrobia bacterium]|jgi:NADH-quinone oxidoreductase subunit I|nr:4Fe-4S dicluster domain-containing protein [Candidatus Neomarinimicrobiota bacterium]MDP6789072.1 4Fe-4S dicluster domain-containing protein [Candidatus Neomarinimicrobiota bacterium]